MNERTKKPRANKKASPDELANHQAARAAQGQTPKQEAKSYYSYMVAAVCLWLFLVGVGIAYLVQHGWWR